ASDSVDLVGAELLSYLFSVKDFPSPQYSKLCSLGHFLLAEYRSDDCQQAEDFRDAPRLRATPTRSVRRLRVEDFANVADGGGREVLSETHCYGPQLVVPIGIDAAPCIDEWADQPGPDCPLVIRDISRAQIAEILWLIVGVTRRERAHPVWRE